MRWCILFPAALLTLLMTGMVPLSDSDLSNINIQDREISNTEVDLIRAFNLDKAEGIDTAFLRVWELSTDNISATAEESAYETASSANSTTQSIYPSGETMSTKQNIPAG